MKTPHVLRLESLTALIRNREELTDEQLIDLLRSMLGCGPSSGALRARRHRNARKRYASVTDVTPDRDERHAEVTQPNAVAPRPSSPPLHSPSDSLTPSDPKESAAVSEGSDRSDAREQKPAAARDWSKRPPANLGDALEMPLQSRSELVLRDAFRASYLDPHRWPEVRLAVVAFREAVRKPRLAVGQFGTDLGVRRLVELYAAGLTADEVCSAIPLVVASPWWTSGDSARDLGSISLTVVRRALAEQPAKQDLAALPRQMFGEVT